MQAATKSSATLHFASKLAALASSAAKPLDARIHLLDNGPIPQLLLVNGTRLYDVSDASAGALRSALDARDTAAIGRILAALNLDAPPAVDERPLEAPPIHALSLAVAQKCNLGCTYCYAQQGTFGGDPRSMSADVARRSVELLLKDHERGSRVTIAFLGGEPLTNRPVVQDATRYAAELGQSRGVDVRFSITTNGTLLSEEDAEFFEKHAFSVTISLDGNRREHDLLRPFRDGSGSYDRILARVRPLLRTQRRMQISARVTVTPANMNLPETLDELIGLGFHSVGFSPLLRSSAGGKLEMDPAHLTRMLEGLVCCGLAFEHHVLRGERYPFLNMVNALRELHRGTHRPYPCGAGAGYFGVSADGNLSACHRFVGDADGAMGSLQDGVDQTRQALWLAQRHVHAQEPCNSCWARYLCGGGCHHEVLARGRPACDFIRGWLHYTIQAYGRLARLAPGWFEGDGEPVRSRVPVDGAAV